MKYVIFPSSSLTILRCIDLINGNEICNFPLLFLCDILRCKRFDFWLMSFGLIISTCYDSMRQTINKVDPSAR